MALPYTGEHLPGSPVFVAWQNSRHVARESQQSTHARALTDLRNALRRPAGQQGRVVVQAARGSTPARVQLAPFQQVSAPVVCCLAHSA